MHDYGSIVSFALSLLDALLFVHYLAVVLLELRSLRPEYRVHVLRSPDGASRSYTLGAVSIQQAAATILNHYYTGDFGVYNQFLERLPTSSTARMRIGGKSGGGSSVHSGSETGFKMYSIDGPNGGEHVSSADVSTQAAAALMIAAARKRESAHNERFYDEMDWERRVRKRKTRLISATEDAFAHIRRLNEQKGGSLGIPNAVL